MGQGIHVVLTPAFAFTAALAGGFLGVAANPEPVQAAYSNPDLSGLEAALKDLQAKVGQAFEGDPMERPVPREAIQAARKPVETVDFSTDLDEFRTLLAELRQVAEMGTPATDPPPVLAFRTAPVPNRQAVQELAIAYREDREAAAQGVLYVHFQEVLARFGRPDGVDDEGRWFWRMLWPQGSKGRHRAYKTLLFSFREEHVVLVTLMG